MTVASSGINKRGGAPIFCNNLYTPPSEMLQRHLWLQMVHSRAYFDPNVGVLLFLEL